LTFCPPGPDDLVKLSMISFSLIAIAGLIRIIPKAYIKSGFSSRTRI
jgi:hypothetical protein